MCPVDAIAHSAYRLAEGNLAARAQVLGRNELALLAQDFNHMAQRIEEQVADIEAARIESELLYTLVVEASKNPETGDVAAGVVRVLLQKLRPLRAAFFFETADGGWTCAAGASGGDERVASGEGALETVLGTGAAPLRLLLAGMPAQLVADACRTRKLQVERKKTCGFGAAIARAAAAAANQGSPEPAGGASSKRQASSAATTQPPVGGAKWVPRTSTG